MFAESKTLWIGDLDPWMDQQNIVTLFSSFGIGQHIISVKVIRDKNTNASAGYGFVQFKTHQKAQSVIHNYNGVPIPGTLKQFKLNWASYGGGSKTITTKTTQPHQQISIYIGQLQQSVTDTILMDVFKELYPSATSAKVIFDSNAKQSKGFGFVKFTKQEEAQKAIVQMNGYKIGGKPIKVSHAYSKQMEALARASNFFGSSSLVTSQMSSYNMAQYIGDQKQSLMHSHMQEKSKKSSRSVKKNLKSELSGLSVLRPEQTQQDLKVLQYYPKMIGYNYKRSIENKILI